MRNVVLVLAVLTLIAGCGGSDTSTKPLSELVLPQDGGEVDDVTNTVVMDPISLVRPVEELQKYGMVGAIQSNADKGDSSVRAQLVRLRDHDAAEQACKDLGVSATPDLPDYIESFDLGVGKSCTIGKVQGAGGTAQQCTGTFVVDSLLVTVRVTDQRPVRDFAAIEAAVRDLAKQQYDRLD